MLKLPAADVLADSAMQDTVLANCRSLGAVDFSCQLSVTPGGCDDPAAIAL